MRHPAGRPAGCFVFQPLLGEAKGGFVGTFDGRAVSNPVHCRVEVRVLARQIREERDHTALRLEPGRLFVKAQFS
jgi:hypothetical protein